MLDANIHRGVVIGRFQPFHNGHLLLIRQILKDCDEVLIIVGSAQLNYTFTNPFTAGERIFMIRGALMEGGVDLSKIIIIPLINVEDNATWYPKLISMVPPFDILYSGNELVVTLASPHLEVKTPKFVNKKRYNGSYIRYRILCGQKWSHLVSKSVFDIICRLDGIKRMKRLAKHESLESRKVVDLQ